MTLADAIRTCKEDGCERKPRHADLGFCDDHQPRWKPEWVRRAESKRLVAKDMTRSAA